MDITLKLRLEKIDETPDSPAEDVARTLVEEFTDTSVYVDHAPDGEVIATEYRITSVAVVDE
jgi:hypothetical protein